MKTNKPKIAFILSQFPETHETFILREFLGFKNANVNFGIFSLKPCKDKIVHPQSKELTEKFTYYAKLISLTGFVYGLMHPLRSINALFYVIKIRIKYPKALLKALYVYVECFDIASKIKKENYTHIHSHWATIPTTAAVILSKLTGLKYSFTAHAWDIFLNAEEILKNKVSNAEFVATCTDFNRKHLENLCSNSTLNIQPSTGNSQQSTVNTMMTDDRKQMTDKKIYLNYHGLDLTDFSFSFQEKNPDKLIMFSIGRMVEQKGFEYLIEACRILKEKNINFELTIVGGGPLLGSLQSTVNSHQLNDYVKFPGSMPQDKIKELFINSTMFVLPCVISENGDRDGIPNVILEAMAIGTPIISTNVSGVPEVIINNETGFAVDQRDPKQLATAIEILYKDKTLQLKFAKNAHKLVSKNFDINTNIQQLIEIYKDKGIL